MTYSEAFSLWVAEVYRNHGYELDKWYGSEVAETCQSILELADFLLLLLLRTVLPPRCGTISKPSRLRKNLRI